MEYMKSKPILAVCLDEALAPGEPTTVATPRVRIFGQHEEI